MFDRGGRLTVKPNRQVVGGPGALRPMPKWLDK
jgi:hypothetical protein